MVPGSLQALIKSEELLTLDLGVFEEDDLGSLTKLVHGLPTVVNAHQHKLVDVVGGILLRLLDFPQQTLSLGAANLVSQLTLPGVEVLDAYLAVVHLLLDVLLLSEVSVELSNHVEGENLDEFVVYHDHERDDVAEHANRKVNNGDQYAVLV